MATDLQQLTIPADSYPSLAPAAVSSPFETAEGVVPLSHYLWVVRRQAWKICALILSSIILTFVISSRLQPVYESTAAISIDREAPNALIGDNARQQVASTQDADHYIATQIKIIQSDSVLRPVAQKYDLLSREGRFKGLNQERLRALIDSPTALRKLDVRRPANTYLVLVSYRSTNAQLAADVANAIAQSYIEHTFRLQIKSATGAAGFMEKQLDELKAKMERSDQALAKFEKELNLVNPEEKTNITSARLLQLNSEYTNAQSDRVRREALFNQMKAGGIAALEISGQSEDLKRLQEKISDAQQRFAEIRSSKGQNHPDYRRSSLELAELEQQFAETRKRINDRIETDYRQALNREQMLQSAVAETKLDLDKLNEKSFDYQRLKQEADADKNLYQELVKKIREAGINAGFQNSNTAIADAARPDSKPVFPNLRLNLIVAAILSTLIGIAGVILLDSLDTTIRDPEEVRSLFNTDLVGTLPYIRDSRQLLLTSSDVTPHERASRKDSGDRTAIMSSFEEGVRMIRNSILLSDFDRRLRSILITSATPGEGKSTVALHLAIAHAHQGKRTLIIDADLRRPTLNRKLNLSGTDGLAEVLTDDIPWQTAVRGVPGHPNLNVLSAGNPSRRASDLIGGAISDLLDEAAGSYDLIIIDAPPLLGFAEPMQLAIAADGVVIVAVAGETNRKAVAAVVTNLQRLRANVIGLVLNRVSRNSGSSYQYYYSYRQYAQYSEPAKG
jgi:succinoglycan biosynthesis transport protein ExoP